MQTMIVNASYGISRNINPSWVISSSSISTELSIAFSSSHLTLQGHAFRSCQVRK